MIPKKQKVTTKKRQKTSSAEENKFLKVLKSLKSIKKTAQDTIMFDTVDRTGIASRGDQFSKTIKFEDINYRLAQREDQEDIFNRYCMFLSYFDENINFQLTFLNQKNGADKITRSIEIQSKNDKLNKIRTEYANIIKEKSVLGKKGIIKEKFLTFSIKAENFNKAKIKLERIENDILNNFKQLGARACVLEGLERLELIYNILHPETKQDFNFDFGILKNGSPVKDYITPASFTFKNRNTFMVEDRFCKTFRLEILASELSDQLLAEFLDLENEININFHVRTIEQLKAIKLAKTKISDTDKMKIEAQKNAIRQGFDMDIIPPELATSAEEAKELLNAIQGRNEKLFMVTITFMINADSTPKLDNLYHQIVGIANKYNCKIVNLDFMQDYGLNASLPICVNEIGIERMLTTTALAVFIPFTTQELFYTTKDSLYYGLNAISNNLIMLDRKMLKNPNGLILGTPGSGKSFSAKREIQNQCLITNDDVIICDPEAEYNVLTETFFGQVIKISQTSNNYINPLDMTLDYDEDNPLALKSDFILSLCELIVGSSKGLEPVEKSIIDRATRVIYNKFLDNPIAENLPILEDLYNAILKQPEPEARKIATALEIYVKGSLNIFNNRTNVDINNRIVNFDIKELGKQLKKLGMLIVQDQVWQKVTKNRNLKKSTWYYCDEFHLLLKEEQTANYSIEIWKRFRKWGGIPTGITQNVKDLLASSEVSNIFDNSDFIIMLNQATTDREILADRLQISDNQLGYVTNSNAGEGLIFFGNVIVPFIDKFPKDTELYKIMTTKLSET